MTKLTEAHDELVSAMDAVRELGTIGGTPMRERVDHAAAEYERLYAPVRAERHARWDILYPDWRNGTLIVDRLNIDWALSYAH